MKIVTPLMVVVALFVTGQIAHGQFVAKKRAPAQGDREQLSKHEFETLVYSPDALVVDKLSVAESIETVRSTLTRFGVREVKVEKRALTLVWDKKRENVKSVDLTQINPQVVLYEYKDTALFIPLNSSWLKIPGVLDSGYGNPKKDEQAFRDLADALLVLKLTASIQTDPAYGRRFEEAVRVYRSSPTKPELPENARRYGVQAFAAVRDQKPGQAADLFAQALEIAPGWAEGHFNLAHTLAEIGRFSDAIVEMSRYIKLAPDAPDARAGQDKIYEWELKVPATSAPSEPALDPATGRLRPA